MFWISEFPFEFEPKIVSVQANMLFGGCSFFFEGKVEQKILCEMSMWILIMQTWFQTRHW